MSTIHVDIQINPSLDRIGRAIGNVELDKELRDIIKDFAFSIERYSKQVTPVDTGRLRSSIGVSFSGGGLGGSALIAPHTFYAGFVHEGTRYMKARPFMKWGVDFAKPKYEREIPARLDAKLRASLSRL